MLSRVPLFCWQVPEIESVTFMKGVAEHINFPNDTFDLITVAQALHWFHLRRFYAEAQRVLKPHGAIAAWAYGMPSFQNHPEASELIQAFTWDTLGTYWPDRTKLILQGYDVSIHISCSCVSRVFNQVVP